MAGGMRPVKAVEGGKASAGEAVRLHCLQLLGTSTQKVLEEIARMVDEFGRTELGGNRPFAIAALKGEIERILVGAHNGIVGALQEGAGGGNGEAQPETE